MGFQENLRLLLQQRGMKQAELCRRTGIQTSLMSDYLGGKKGPTIGNAILIADALGISLDALVGKPAPAGPGQEQPEGKVFTELCKAAKGLSEQQQLYLLDVIEALQKHLGRPGG